MIPFDGNFAERTVLPLAEAAYDSTKLSNHDSFETKSWS